MNSRISDLKMNITNVESVRNNCVNEIRSDIMENGSRNITRKRSNGHLSASSSTFSLSTSSGFSNLKVRGGQLDNA